MAQNSAESAAFALAVLRDPTQEQRPSAASDREVAPHTHPPQHTHIQAPSPNTTRHTSDMLGGGDKNEQMMTFPSTPAPLPHTHPRRSSIPLSPLAHHAPPRPHGPPLPLPRSTHRADPQMRFHCLSVFRSETPPGPMRFRVERPSEEERKACQGGSIRAPFERPAPPRPTLPPPPPPRPPRTRAPLGWPGVECRGKVLNRAPWPDPHPPKRGQSMGPPKSNRDRPPGAPKVI